MIVILKIILGLFALLGGVVIQTLYKDFKNTEKTSQYDELSVADKIKIKTVLYISMTAIVAFCLLLVYFIIVPVQINLW
jgi:type III secretory pathway component EscV